MRTCFTLGLLLSLSLVGCSGGGGSSSGESSGDFYVLGANVATGQEWRINRPIEVSFSADVDFATVNLNTVRIADDTGFSAIGFFYQPTDAASGDIDLRTVIFQPTCPTLEDASDAGLLPFRNYRLIVVGGPGAPTLLSTAGDSLDGGIVREFHTPNSYDPLDLFVDTVAGPPLVMVLPTRPQPGQEIDPDTPATHVEIGGVQRFFGREPATQEGRLEVGLSLPLSHYSLPENQISFVIQFNQAVLSSPENLARLRMEYNTSAGWAPVGVQVELDANCTENGARVRMTPLGVLPQNSELRAVLDQGFQDITGDGTSAQDLAFVRAETVPAGDPNPIFPHVSNPEVDEVLESFALTELEDTDVVFPVPSATWSNGLLAASFDFGGTGGPGGDFDWHIPPATEMVLDTNSDVIFGGPGGAQTKSQPVTNGVVDIRDMYLPASSKLRIVGPNACTILASGSVRILGEITVSGSDNPGVATLKTANQPEPGAIGNAGGGDGGTGSFLTTQSTPRGGEGNGPFGQLGGGGQGGETSYRASASAQRRGSGGGGGVLGADVRYDHDGLPGTVLVRCQILIGLDAEYGNAGSQGALGAESQSERAKGGTIGPAPFKDANPDNNFLGTKRTTEGKLHLGELAEIWAGEGGGGGGDSTNSAIFPHPNFGPGSDEKGAGGGGGAGGLLILAIGPITVGSEEVFGRISAEGGAGGGGEHGSLRIGGGSGGGSGGHIVMSSADEIFVHGRAESAGPWYHDTGSSHDFRSINAVGGQGGCGNICKGGAEVGTTGKWSCDRIPFDYLEYPDVPPYTTSCFTNLPDFSDAEGPVVAAGGDGGPGMVQFHVEDLADLHFPTLEAEFGGSYPDGLDVTYVCAPPPLGWKEPGVEPDQMVPFFGRVSMARSRWIPLGLARADGSGGLDQVMLVALGGAVPHDAGETVLHDDPLVGPETLGAPTYEISLDASGLDPGDERYRENAALLRLATVRLEDSSDGGNFAHFVVAQATYDGGTDRFELMIDPNGPNPATFIAAGQVHAYLVPHHLRVVTAGIEDAYPADTDVLVHYDATVVDPFSGGPSESLSYSAQNGDLPTDDVDDLNHDHWDFVRFQVTFDLDTNGGGVNPTSPRPALNHLRVQFEF